MPHPLPHRFISITATGMEDDDIRSLVVLRKAHEYEVLAMEIDATTFQSRCGARVCQVAYRLGIEINLRLASRCVVDHAMVEDMRSHACSSVTVAIDGHDEAAHDSFHGGPGAFSRALRSIEQAGRLGFDIYVLSRILGPDSHLARLSTIPRWLGAKAWFISFSAPPDMRYRGARLTIEERRVACVALSDIADNHRLPTAIRCRDWGEACRLDPALVASLPRFHRRGGPACATPAVNVAEAAYA